MRDVKEKLSGLAADSLRAPALLGSCMPRIASSPLRRVRWHDQRMLTRMSANRIPQSFSAKRQMAY